MFSGKDSMYKFFWVGEPYGTERVGILLKEMLDEHSVDVNWANDRIIVVKVVVGSTVIIVACV